MVTIEALNRLPRRVLVKVDTTTSSILVMPPNAVARIIILGGPYAQAPVEEHSDRADAR
jgi:hypothetical protein